MHSCRMHTVRCSGRLSCHAHPLPLQHTPPVMHAPLPCMPLPCTAPYHPWPPAMHMLPAIHAPLPHMPPATHSPCHACSLPCMPLPPPCMPCVHAPTVDRILNTRFWKHYLSATTVQTVKIWWNKTVIYCAFSPVWFSFSIKTLNERY